MCLPYDWDDALKGGHAPKTTAALTLRNGGLIIPCHPRASRYDFPDQPSRTEQKKLTRCFVQSALDSGFRDIDDRDNPRADSAPARGLFL